MTDWDDMIMQKQELRDELLEYCDGECDRCPYGKRIPADRGCGNICRKALERLPSAQQKTCVFWDSENDFCALRRLSARLKGKWKVITNNRGRHAECPFCGEWKYHNNQKFCGECGAELKGEEDGSAIIPSSRADKPDHS